MFLLLTRFDDLLPAICGYFEHFIHFFGIWSFIVLVLINSVSSESSSFKYFKAPLLLQSEWLFFLVFSRFLYDELSGVARVKSLDLISSLSRLIAFLSFIGLSSTGSCLLFLLLFLLYGLLARILVVEEDL